MEDRGTWGEIERTISETLAEISNEKVQVLLGGEIRIGLSPVRRIADALRAKRLVRGRTTENVPLLGKRVKVTYNMDSKSARITEGILLGLGEGGTFEILEDDGFVHYGWPALELEKVGEDGE